MPREDSTGHRRMKAMIGCQSGYVQSEMDAIKKRLDEFAAKGRAK